jgi:hypothetical protein
MVSWPWSMFSTWRHSAISGPTHGVAGEHVQDDVEVEPGPLVGAGQFGDVPAPHLVGGGGDELGLDGGGVAGLAATLADLGAGSQQPIHGRDRTQIDAVVEQVSPYLGGGQVAELVAVEDLDDVVALSLAERPGRARSPVSGLITVRTGRCAARSGV